MPSSPRAAAAAAAGPPRRSLIDCAPSRPPVRPRPPAAPRWRAAGPAATLARRPTSSKCASPTATMVGGAWGAAPLRLTDTPGPCIAVDEAVAVCQVLLLAQQRGRGVAQQGTSVVTRPGQQQQLWLSRACAWSRGARRAGGRTIRRTCGWLLRNIRPVAVWHRPHRIMGAVPQWKAPWLLPHVPASPQHDASLIASHRQSSPVIAKRRTGQG